jgi:Fic family protein
MTAIDDPVDATLIDRILGEYREMPGLALTINQAQRLWGCEAETVRRLIDVLVSRGVLQWSRDGRLTSR